DVVNSSFISRFVRDRNPGDEVEVVWQTEEGETKQATATLDEAEIN
ncbi:MAG: trypsin, partial [Micrococcus sp.]|nr:trypsin [Micrococcus sp.]